MSRQEVREILASAGLSLIATPKKAEHTQTSTGTREGTYVHKSERSSKDTRDKSRPPA